MTFNYFLFITRNGETSAEIANDFLKEYNPHNVFIEMGKSQNEEADYGDYHVLIVSFEVEKDFIDFLFSYQQGAGLINVLELQSYDFRIKTFLKSIDKDAEVIFIMDGEDVTDKVYSNEDIQENVMIDGLDSINGGFVATIDKEEWESGLAYIAEQEDNKVEIESSYDDDNSLVS